MKALLVFLTVISFGVFAAENSNSNLKKLQRLCEEMSQLNLDATNIEDWSISVDLKDLPMNIQALREIVFEGVRIPVVKGRLLAISRVDEDGIATTKLEFSEGIVEVKFIKYSDSYVKDVSKSLARHSTGLSEKYLNFINGKNFSEKVKWYISNSTYSKSCANDSVAAWKKLYVETVLADGTVMMDRKHNPSLFGGGILYALRGYDGFGFTGMTDDRAYLVQVIGYTK